MNTPAPKILPIAKRMPLSDPDATTAVIKSGAPLAKAINVTLNFNVELSTQQEFDSFSNTAI
jgi:hypothetical protein